MSSASLSTHEKALQVNLDPSKYGAFAEIGAGQEVARWFFRVGGAAGTISKSISAYDMTVSDAIYGSSERYVSRQRLQTMLQYEYGLQSERLSEKRGTNTRFFVFADTIAARSYKRTEEGHGWLGIRFQTQPLAPPSDIIIHVRLHDRENVQQQEALGIIGVNLVHSALYLHDRPGELVKALMDNLNPERMEVDMLKFSGPGFEQVDNRLIALQLVEQRMTDAAMFTAEGEVVQASEVLYKKPVLVERGSFRPVTLATANMLDCAYARFLKDPQVQGEPEVVVLMEMTLRHLAEGGVIDHQDFLDRVDMLGALGKTVLISNYGEFYRLARYLFRHTRKRIALAMGVPTLLEVFDEKYYTHLDGGLLESFGRLFKNGLKLYVYPYQDPASQRLITADTAPVAVHVRHLHRFLVENQYIESLESVDPNHLSVFPHAILEKIQAGDPSWESMVPTEVAKIIRQRRLFGCK